MRLNPTMLPRLCALGAALLVASPAVAECEQRVPTGALTRSVTALEQAWVDFEEDEVIARRDDLMAEIECVDVPLSPTLAARVHRALGLGHVAAGDPEAGARAFLAAREADPTLGMTSTLAPEGSPVERLYLRPGAGIPPTPLDRPRRGRLLLDGRASDERSSEHPTVLQHLSSRGDLQDTWLLEPGQPLPEEPWLDPRRGARLGTRVAGLALVAAGIGALGIAGGAAQAHAGPAARSRSDLETLKGRSRTFTVLGGALVGVGTLGVGVSFTGPLQ